MSVAGQLLCVCNGCAGAMVCACILVSGPSFGRCMLPIRPGLRGMAMGGAPKQSAAQADMRQAVCERLITHYSVVMYSVVACLWCRRGGGVAGSDGEVTVD
jgi:hypothetical protein